MKSPCFIGQKTIKIKSRVDISVNEKMIELCRNRFSQTWTGLTIPIPTVAPIIIPPTAPPGIILQLTLDSHRFSQYHVIPTANAKMHFYNRVLVHLLEEICTYSSTLGGRRGGISLSRHYPSDTRPVEWDIYREWILKSILRRIRPERCHVPGEHTPILLRKYNLN